jgi:hypothetical protein
MFLVRLCTVKPASGSQSVKAHRAQPWRCVSVPNAHSRGAVFPYQTRAAVTLCFRTKRAQPWRCVSVPNAHSRGAVFPYQTRTAVALCFRTKRAQPWRCVSVPNAHSRGAVFPYQTRAAVALFPYQTRAAVALCFRTKRAQPWRCVSVPKASKKESKVALISRAGLHNVTVPRHWIFTLFDLGNCRSIMKCGSTQCHVASEQFITQPADLTWRISASVVKWGIGLTHFYTSRLLTVQRLYQGTERWLSNHVTICNCVVFLFVLLCLFLFALFSVCAFAIIWWSFSALFISETP